MIFTYSIWENFCKTLDEKGVHSVTAKSLLHGTYAGKGEFGRWLNLKHDVESTPSKALRLAEIEAKYGHRATYYVQSYLMVEENCQLFSKIRDLGHEVAYHHDVMDGSKGDLELAIKIFDQNLVKFKTLGFVVETVCQHGNPMSSYENRDFFRSKRVRVLYPNIADIMVNFADLIGRQYVYVSDVGMSFKIVKDPVNSDKLVERDKYIELGSLDKVVNEFFSHPDKNYMVSSHPHRYYQSYFKAWIKTAVFAIIRGSARMLFKIPGFKKCVFKFNFISKKL